MFNLESRPKLKRGCRPCERDSFVLLMPEGIIRLKGSGRLVLSLCDGNQSLSQIFEHLNIRFPNENYDQIQKEVLEFLGDLIKRGALHSENVL